MSETGKQLSGRVVLVTGASSGIGEGTALALAAAGASVVVAGRRAGHVAKLAQRIGGDALSLELDVTSGAAIARAIEEIRARFGRLDGLVNSAGIMLSARVADADPEDWRTMLDINLLGLMEVTRAALPLLKENGGGDIFNISSISARLANAGSPAYAATKAGLGAFNESLRKETFRDGIRVTLVMPGIVETELFTHLKDPATRERFGGMMKQLTPLQPSDIGNAIVYVMSQPPHVSINEIVMRPSLQPE
jgi:NADP-dependent 3-hydroxy acid dehydrogenase YdfG